MPSTFKSESLGIDGGEHAILTFLMDESLPVTDILVFRYQDWEDCSFALDEAAQSMGGVALTQ